MHKIALTPVNLQFYVLTPTSTFPCPIQGMSSLREWLCLLQAFVSKLDKNCSLTIFQDSLIFRSHLIFPMSFHSLAQSYPVGILPALLLMPPSPPLTSQLSCSLLLCTLNPAYLGSRLVDFVEPQPGIHGFWLGVDPEIIVLTLSSSPSGYRGKGNQFSWAINLWSPAKMTLSRKMYI